MLEKYSKGNHSINLLFFKRIKIFCLGAIAWLSSCRSIEVYYEHNQEIDFKQYKTFNIHNKVDSLPLVPMNLRILKNEVSRQMTTKGYELAEKPDIIIHIDIYLATRSYAYTEDYTPLFSSSKSLVVVNVFQEGTLLIDHFDTSNNEKISQGYAIALVSSEYKNANNIVKALKRMYKDFPVTK